MSFPQMNIFSGLRPFFHISFVICLPLFFSCSDVFLPYHAEDWRSGWEMRWVDEERFFEFSPDEENKAPGYKQYRIPHISMEHPTGNIFIARKKWTGGGENEHPSLYIRGGARLYDIYCGSEKISRQFSLEKKADASGNITYQRKYDSSFFPVIALPESCKNQNLYVIFFSENNFPVGFTESPVYSDLTSNYKALENRNQSFAGIGFFFIVLGVFSSYLYLRRKKRSLIAFTIFSLVSGLHFMSQVGFWGYFFYDDSLPDFYIFVLTLFAIPISGLYFFDKLFGVGRMNIIRMLWQFHIVFSIVILTLAFSGAVTFTLALITFAWVSLPSLILQVLIAWSEIVSGKPRAWILAIGALILLVFNGHDILVAMDLVHAIGRLAPWGFFLFVLSLSLYGEHIFRDSEVRYVALQKEIVTAARIQNAILPPSPPNWENMKIAVYYQPSHEVGGDFYDFQALGNRKYGILIADVVGHGLGASIIASLSKFAFFQNHQYWTNPCFLLAAMNDDLVKRSQGRFTTASYFYLDREKMHFTVSSAGHPSCFHWSRSKGEINEIKPKGHPLGILENLSFFEEEYPFEVGDKFLFYTDGLTEELDKTGEEFGSEKLKKCFFDAVSLPSNLAVHSIIDEFKKELSLDGLPHDDITLIILEVL